MGTKVVMHFTPLCEDTGPEPILNSM